MTILIVDDEKNIRAGIRKILGEALTPDIRYHEAKNGLEALEIGERVRADLVITDIRMPKMDGIELMRRMSPWLNRPEILILSGYDEFAYAKEAINYGAASYILKPVDRNELISTVTEALSRIGRRKKRKTENGIRKVMAEGRLSAAVEFGDFSFEEPYYFVIVTGTASRSVDAESIPAIEGQSACYVVENSGSSLALLIHEEEKARLEEYGRSAGIFVGISGVCAGPAKLRTARRQALVASCGRFFDMDSWIFHYAEPIASLDRSWIDSFGSKLHALIGTGDVAAISACIDGLFRLDSVPLSDRPRYFILLQDFIEADILRKHWEYVDADMYLTLKELMIEEIGRFRCLEDYHRAVRDFVIYLDSVRKKERAEYPFITAALEYIRAHFTEDISMTVVANHVSVNYTWFSEKFKEQMGINFNDYLKTLRIDEAKRLLENGCYRVYEAAAKSGFGDVKYFGRTFKEATGLSPGEYRKRF